MAEKRTKQQKELRKMANAAVRAGQGQGEANRQDGKAKVGKKEAKARRDW